MNLCARQVRIADGLLYNCSALSTEDTLSNSVIWTKKHCEALQTGNCSAFPADKPNHALGKCQLPTRYVFTYTSRSAHFAWLKGTYWPA